jgi:pyruvate dehydrogenase E2 component (dihydrolipoamide acetyltransferase)
MARELAVELASVTGTGREGMVTGEDVERAAAMAPTAEVEPEEAELSRERRIFGARMQRSKQTVPHFYLLVDADMTAAAELRERCRTELRWARVPTYTDLVVAASAAALAREPRLNAALVDGQLIRRRAVNVGIAVAGDEGLVVPVVAEADRLGLQAISEQTRALAERARARRLKPADVAEKSIVVSNLGMHGVDAFLAIIDAPDPLILSVGRVAQRCVPIDGGIGIRPLCTLGLSVDHRVLDGVDGARFLALVR